MVLSTKQVVQTYATSSLSLFYVGSPARQDHSELLSTTAAVVGEKIVDTHLPGVRPKEVQTQHTLAVREITNRLHKHEDKARASRRQKHETTGGAPRGRRGKTARQQKPQRGARNSKQQAPSPGLGRREDEAVRGTTGERRSKMPKDQQVAPANRTAVFHSCIRLQLLFLFAGVSAHKIRSESSARYLPMSILVVMLAIPIDR